MTFLNLFRFVLRCLSVSPASMYVHHRHLQISEEGARSLGVWVTDGWEPPCACWEIKPGLLRKQQVLLAHWAISPAPTFSEYFLYVGLIHGCRIIKGQLAGLCLITILFFPTLLCQYYAVVFPRTPKHFVSRLTEHLDSSMDIHTPVSHSSSNQAKPAQSASKIRLAQGDVARRNFLIDQSIIFLKIVLILLLCFFQMNWKLSKYFSLAAFYSNVMESLNAIMSLLPWVP